MENAWYDRMLSPPGAQPAMTTTHTAPRPSPRHFATLLLVAFSLASAGCESSSPEKARTRTSPPPATPSPIVESEADPTEDLEFSARESATILAKVYKDARPKVGAVRGTVRYWGDYTYGVLIGAALLENEIGFRGFEYRLDCDAPNPPPVCSVARAFQSNDLTEAAGHLATLGAEDIQIVVEGRADGAWTSKKKPEIYKGECGEAQCDSGAILEIASGMPVDSNEKLACLRALCVFSESGLAKSGIPARIRGAISDSKSKAEQRRAELAFEGKLAGDAHRYFWRAFRSAVGH